MSRAPQRPPISTGYCPVTQYGTPTSVLKDKQPLSKDATPSVAPFCPAPFGSEESASLPRFDPDKVEVSLVAVAPTRRPRSPPPQHLADFRDPATYTTAWKKLSTTPGTTHSHVFHGGATVFGEFPKQNAREPTATARKPDFTAAELIEKGYGATQPNAKAAAFPASVVDDLRRERMAATLHNHVDSPGPGRYPVKNAPWGERFVSSELPDAPRPHLPVEDNNRVGAVQLQPEDPRRRGKFTRGPGAYKTPLGVRSHEAAAPRAVMRPPGEKHAVREKAKAAVSPTKADFRNSPDRWTRKVRMVDREGGTPSIVTSPVKGTFGKQVVSGTKGESVAFGFGPAAGPSEGALC